MTHAHGFVEPGDVWQAWSVEPMVLAAGVLAALLYARGARSWRSSSSGMRSLPARRVACFYTGVVAALLAVLSPLGALGETLFAAHMVQHLTLMLVSAPLLVYGAPFLAMSRALWIPIRRALHPASHGPVLRRLQRVISSAVAIWIINTTVLWVWHSPALYERAVRSEWIHALEHGALFGTATLFWWVVLRPSRTGHGAALLLTFTTALQSAALGALLALAGEPLYQVHSEGARAWGLTTLQDQQLAGVFMWIPPGIAYVVVMALLLGGWLRDAERRMARKEARAVATAGAVKR